MSSAFLENSENFQNHDIFEGAVMGRPIYTTRRFWPDLLINLYFFSKRNHVFINNILSANKVFPKTMSEIKTLDP